MKSADQQIVKILADIRDGGGGSGGIPSILDVDEVKNSNGDLHIWSDHTILYGTDVVIGGPNYLSNDVNVWQSDIWFAGHAKVLFGIPFGGSFPEIPGIHMYVAKPTGLGHIYTECFSDSASAANKIVIARSRGTLALPLGLNANDLIGEYGFAGRAAGAGVGTDAVLMRCTATETHVPGASGVKVEMRTCANGSATPITRLLINELGDISFSGQFAPRAGSTADGTAPLKLTSGALNTLPALGAIEFSDPALYVSVTNPFGIDVERQSLVMGPGTAPIFIVGPTTTRAFTFPNSNATMLYSGGALGTPASGTLTSCTGLPLTTGVTGILPVTNGGTGVGAANVHAPFYVRGTFAVLTAGTPADIGSITIPLPTGVTRYRLCSTVATASPNTIISETATGGTFVGRDAAAGGGNIMMSSISGPATPGTCSSWAATLVTLSTALTIFIHQTAVATAGTMSFQFLIIPLP